MRWERPYARLMTEHVVLFCYGALRLPVVQRELFGRLPDADDDVLVGFTVDYVEIDDERATRVTGETVHPVARHTGQHVDKVIGRALHLTEDELEAADELESLGFARRPVRLASGREGWAFVAA